MNAIVKYIAFTAIPNFLKSRPSRAVNRAWLKLIVSEAVSDALAEPPDCCLLDEALSQLTRYHAVLDERNPGRLPVFLRNRYLPSPYPVYPGLNSDVLFSEYQNSMAELRCWVAAYSAEFVKQIKAMNGEKVKEVCGAGLHVFDAIKDEVERVGNEKAAWEVVELQTLQAVALEAKRYVVDGYALNLTRAITARKIKRRRVYFVLLLTLIIIASVKANFASI